MANPGDFAYTLKQQADIVRIVGDYVKLKKTGAQNYSGLCPFHGEKTASFSVHATRQFFHCFGCGVSGDVFSFVQKIENITFPEAIRMVAQKLGVPVPKATFSSPAEAREAGQRTLMLDIHERACAFFQECLRRPEGARAREYLASRGLDEATIKAFRIGFAPDSGFVLRDRLKDEFAEDILRESGLFSWKENAQTGPAGDSSNLGTGREKTSGSRLTALYSKFRNRIMFPITSEAGRVIAFTGRTLSTDEKAGPKYLNSPETPIYSKSRVLFNLDLAKEAIRKLDYAILVEGQMDCISVYAAGFRNVIASSGTAFTELQAKLLGRFSNKIVVNFDPDTAGARATERTLGTLVEEEFVIRVLTLEAGFDPDLFIRRKGKDEYAQALKKSQPYFDYLIERACGQFSVRTPEGKVKAVNHLLPHIQRVPSRIIRDELATQIAQRLGIDSTVLRQELKHAAVNRSSAGVKSKAEIQVTDAEKVLIRALLSGREMAASGEHVSSRDGGEETFDAARQARFALQTERLHLGLPTESLLEALLALPQSTDPLDLPVGDSVRNLLATVLINEAEELSPELVEGAVRALRRTQLRRKLENVKVELTRLRNREEVQALLEEKIRLKRALMDPALADGPSVASPPQ
jgi:DNA primase